MTLVDDVLSLAPIERRVWLAEQSEDDFAAILVSFRQQLGTPWAIFQGDPVGFIEQGLGFYIWSRQQAVCEMVHAHRRIAIASANGVGKTMVAGLLAAYWVSVHEPGSALVVSTAKTWSHVKNQLWKHIRHVVRTHQLPGFKQCNLTDWSINEFPVALGFSPKDEEAAAQGYHAAHLLVIVDEAGGVPMTIGDSMNSLMTGADCHILAIGNPPTDTEGEWFEKICGSPLWATMPIPLRDSPNFTAEKLRTPPDVLEGLVGHDWLRETTAYYGVESSYYIARVLAQFPKSAASRAIPVAWIEQCMENEEPAKSGWQRLGVDIADGGEDETVVAHADGFTLKVVDSWSGSESADQVTNAERILEHIQHAEAAQAKRGYTERKTRVKIDAVGVGAGTADMLTRYGKEKRHGADIVHVNVGEAASDRAQFLNRRAEAWWNLRELCRQMDVNLVGLTERQKAQLAGPLYDTNSAEKTYIESKDSMKKRGLNSPDHADALILAVYEPHSVVPAATYAQQMASARMPVSIGRRRS